MEMLCRDKGSGEEGEMVRGKGGAETEEKQKGLMEEIKKEGERRMRVEEQAYDEGGRWEKGL